MDGREADYTKHLEFIQAAISRLATNSFLLKGWALTAVGALLSLGITVHDWRLSAIGLLPAFGFWFLDAYFLRMERLYRLLYEDARLGRIDVFVMSVDRYQSRVGWRKIWLSTTVGAFYGVMGVLSLLVSIATAGIL